MARSRILRNLAAGLVMAGTVIAAPVGAWAQVPPQPRKVALLIGNGDYANPPAGAKRFWPKLRNAGRDINLVKRSLQAIGFTVVPVTDADLAHMDGAITDFARLAKGADVVLFYYGGHGFEYDRHNYLVPTDAPITVSATALPQRFVDLEKVAHSIEGAHITVLMLDACRNPGPAVTVTNAEAQADIAAKTIADYDLQGDGGQNVGVLYSTARGVVAKDAVPDTALNSPFAQAVAQNLVIPNVDLVMMFGWIAYGVRQRTSDPGPAQNPYTYNDLEPESYLYTGPSLTLSSSTRTPARVAPAEPESTAPVRQASGSGQSRSIEQVDDVAPLDLDPKLLATADGGVIAAKVLSERPVEDLEALAARKDPIASYVLGFLYEFGVGVPMDLDRAHTLLDQSARKGSPEGQLALAYFLLHHPAKGAEDRDYRKAFDLYRKAALSRPVFPKAMGNYAQVLWGGQPRLNQFLNRDPRKNFEAGMKQMRKAADAGYPYAMYSIALRSTDGSERTKWKEKLGELAQGGDPEGDHWLCELGVRQDNEDVLADKHCLLAAQGGYPEAQTRLALAYDRVAAAASDDASHQQALDEARHWARQALAQETQLNPDLRADLDRLDPRLFPAKSAPPAASTD